MELSYIILTLLALGVFAYLYNQGVKIITWYRREKKRTDELHYFANYKGPYIVMSHYPGDPTVYERASIIEQKLIDAGNRWNVVVVPIPMNVVLKDGKVDKSLPNETWPQYIVRAGRETEELDGKYKLEYNDRGSKTTLDLLEQENHYN